MQTSRSEEKRRNRAAQILMNAGERSGNGGLMSLATKMRVKGLRHVTENVELMIKQLNKQQADEVKQNKHCHSEFDQHEKDVEAKSTKKVDLEQKIEDVSMQAENIRNQIAGLNARLTDVQVEMKKASVNRKKENEDFQVTIQDQRATQTILRTAMETLKAFYEKRSLLQLDAKQLHLQQQSGASENKFSRWLHLQQQPEVPANKFAKNPGGSGVIAMLGSILEESKNMEEKALAAENDSQAAYETFVKDSNESIEALQKSLAQKQKVLSEKDEEKTLADGDLTHTISDLEGLHEYGEAMHSECDFLTRNFNKRQAARAQEIDALKSARDIFGGLPDF
jgi:hypothetical protein